MAEQRSSEAQPGALPAMIAAALLIAAHVGGKATRDAMFLATFGATELPKAMLASAVLSTVGVVAMAQGLGSLGPARLVPWLLGASAVLFGGERVLADRAPALAAGLVYLHVAGVGTLLLSGFWSVVSERFDPYSAKRIIGRITGAATVGGLGGGILAERAAALFDARAMLVALGVLHALGAVAVARIGAGPPRKTGGVGALEGLRELKRAPYLKMLALLVALTAFTAGCLDFAFKAQAATSLGSREQLMSFFAVFYMASGLVTFGAQTLLSRRALERLGIGGTVAILPAAVLVSAIVGASVLRLATVALARATEAVLQSSLYRAGYELLFTPIAPERKRPTKTVIDVGFDRLGDALSGAVVLGFLALAASSAVVASIVAAAVAALLSLLVALRLHRGYVEELERSLRTGTVSLDPQQIVDATSRRTLADTTLAIDREQLLKQIEALRAAGGTVGPRISDRGADEPPPSLAPESLPFEAAELHPAAKAVAVLTGKDARRIRSLLRDELDPRLCGFVVPLLAEDAFARDARRILRKGAPGALGQLVDALLDPTQPSRVRRRLADLLATVPERRAALGLFLGLDSAEAEVRERCALGLADLVRAHPELRPPSADVLAVVEREVGRDPPRLPHVFLLLGLVLDAEPLKLALGALKSDDANLRGTSYEYLENVLPPAVRRGLWPHLEAWAKASAPAAEPSRPRRPTKDIADALKQSVDSLAIDREIFADLRRDP